MASGKNADEERNEYNELNPAQAFYIFLENKVKPYYQSLTISGQSFRDDQLWVHDIDMVYTINELAIRELFRKYQRPGQDTLTEPDFDRMLIEDAKIPGVTHAMVREAFGMSQMTVVQESDEKAFATYSHSKFAENLEVLARISVFLFEGSEMESEDLKLKLEHLLNELFKTINKKVKFNRIIIEEFSDSDDDY